MRRSDFHEYRHACNAQAVVCAKGAQLILAINLVATTVLVMQATIGLPRTVLADTGYASGPAVAELQTREVEPLVAIGRTQMQRLYDFRSPAPPRTPRRNIERWRLTMKARLESEEDKSRYKRRKRTVEPVFGTIKSAVDFIRFRLCGILRQAVGAWTFVSAIGASPVAGFSST